ncbi:PTS sugar transporter subunit IIA [Floricoccus penangensis]|uniref:PTS sugar transporter subunit IIA n=1 Tax=Floricoccus penangensis TaxID=1859475 RepID=UPI002041CE9E|nr:PTS sugar transporter subunit IIA [Floricoccus penangensis]URZ86851.1 PTS sugar transporter subunit IIA [Floricoccus penangensis]
MLNYLLENDLIRFSEKDPIDWKDAIKISSENLLEKDLITEEYISELINSVEEYGPYIVLVPGVAMPHSQAESEAVKGTAITFTHFNNPISFEDGNEEKDAQLFFTLAAKNPAEHMENIANLSELLMEDGMIESLIAARSIEDIKELL